MPDHGGVDLQSRARRVDSAQLPIGAVSPISSDLVCFNCGGRHTATGSYVPYHRPMEAEVRYQLRDYRITPGGMTEFVTEWTAQVVPLRTLAGFEIVGARLNPETNRFVWVVAHPGDFEEADRLYYASPDRRRLSPDPARFIEEAKAEFVTPVI